MVPGKIVHPIGKAPGPFLHDTIYYTARTNLKSQLSCDASLSCQCSLREAAIHVVPIHFFIECTVGHRVGCCSQSYKLHFFDPHKPIFFFFFEIAYSLEAIRIREEVRRCSGRKGEKGKGGGERTKSEDFVEGKIVYSELMYDIDYQPSANLCK